MQAELTGIRCVPCKASLSRQACSEHHKCNELTSTCIITAPEASLHLYVMVSPHCFRKNKVCTSPLMTNVTCPPVRQGVKSNHMITIYHTMMM